VAFISKPIEAGALTNFAIIFNSGQKRPGRFAGERKANFSKMPLIKALLRRFGKVATLSETAITGYFGACLIAERESPAKSWVPDMEPLQLVFVRYAWGLVRPDRDALCIHSEFRNFASVIFWSLEASRYTFKQFQLDL
jgi:hypothetical protein